MNVSTVFCVTVLLLGEGLYNAFVCVSHSSSVSQTQQKCIAIFALLCCFAVLVVLIFSSVDIWGDDEDGITEENCSRDCRCDIIYTYIYLKGLLHQHLCSRDIILHSTHFSPFFKIYTTHNSTRLPTSRSEVLKGYAGGFWSPRRI